jgi:cell division protein DivIC
LAYPLFIQMERLNLENNQQDLSFKKKDLKSFMEKDSNNKTSRKPASERIWVRSFHFLPSWLRNKYFLSFTGFVVWMLFFDRNDLITQHHRTQEFQELLQSKQHYNQQITDVRSQLDLLKNNPFTLEKYAREKYYMKRENEELFIIATPDEKN